MVASAKSMVPLASEGTAGARLTQADSNGSVVRKWNARCVPFFSYRVIQSCSVHDVSNCVVSENSRASLWRRKPTQSVRARGTRHILGGIRIILCYELRKPFDMLVEGLKVPSSRAEWTAVELFIEAAVGASLPTAKTERSTPPQLAGRDAHDTVLPTH
jgi:hypothetical protein